MTGRLEPIEPGAGKPVEPEERGRRIVLILLIGVVIVFGLIVLIAIIAPDS